mgnify:CR=1 FL=1
MDVSLTLIIIMAILFACGVYAMLERSLTRVLIGFLLLGNATNLLPMIVMGVLGGTFTRRQWWVLYAAGIWLYMCLIPAVEAAEQTVIQRVVPFDRPVFSAGRCERGGPDLRADPAARGADPRGHRARCRRGGHRW